MESLKKNFSLVVGISIPLLMILLIAGSIYLPGLFTQPQYDFLYETGDVYGQADHWQVINGKLQTASGDTSERYTYRKNGSVARLYRYDVAAGQSREVSLAEVQDLSLDTSARSPDGFEVVPGSRATGFFVFMSSSNDYSKRYLRGNGVSEKLDIRSDGPLYYSNFQFLGWIKK